MKYRGFNISNNCPPIPVREFDWSATHEDYDGTGIVLHAPTLAEMKREIDNNLFSNCCFETAIDNTDLCSKCKEHAEFITYEEMENE